MGPPPSKPTPAAKPARPKDVPLDLFLPPEASAEEVELKLDTEPLVPARRATTSPSTSPTATPPNATPILTKRALTTKPPVLGVVTSEPPRWRFGAGVIVAVVLGFVPAHIVASMRESSAFEKIDRHVIQEQEASVTMSDARVKYDELDTFRDQQLSRKESEQRNITLVALAMWAAIGAVLAYVWFKLIPWDRLRL